VLATELSSQSSTLRIVLLMPFCPYIIMEKDGAMLESVSLPSTIAMQAACLSIFFMMGEALAQFRGSRERAPSISSPTMESDVGALDRNFLFPRNGETGVMGSVWVELCFCMTSATLEFLRFISLLALSEELRSPPRRAMEDSSRPDAWGFLASGLAVVVCVLPSPFRRLFGSLRLRALTAGAGLLAASLLSRPLLTF